ncbi:MAG: hypothetical protein F2573_05110 [Actinobacteria bacterium]|nr:hypothetical protein [Actinomycetota bacterium]
MVSTNSSLYSEQCPNCLLFPLGLCGSNGWRVSNHNCILLDEQSRKCPKTTKDFQEMITLIAPLIFISPVLLYSGFLLIQEFQDPVGPFHERYRTQKIVQAANQRKDDKQKDLYYRKGILSQLGNLSQWKILIVVSSSILFIAVKPSLQSLLTITFIICLYLYYEKRRALQAEKFKSMRISQELPAVTEIFAILISSGASISSALEVLSRSVSGEITSILCDGIERLRDGAPLTYVLDNISQESEVPQLRRFCDSLIIASERGTSLSEVLARQVHEIRSKEHATKLENAGRAEIALMIPVVFLILPISVLFALWPSYIALGQSVLF